MAKSGKYITCNIVHKFGDNDFSLWTVDIDERDFKAAMEGSTQASGNPESVMEYLPVVTDPINTLNFAYIDPTQLKLITTEVDDEYIIRYQNEGGSIRGPLQEILHELRSINAICPDVLGELRDETDYGIEP